MGRTRFPDALGPRGILLAFVLASVLIASFAGPVSADRDRHTQIPVTAQTGEAGDAPPDPAGDTIGWENGYWYNESIDVSQVDGDGLSDAEQARFLARTMARVERLRGLEFTENVSLRFVSRERFRAGFSNGTLPATLASEQLYDSFTLSEGFWEAVFFHGEHTSARREIRDFGAEAILAYSAEEGFENEVIVVTDSVEAPAVSGTVLAHELVHALQGQHFDLDAPRYRPATHDARLAKDGIVEGAAAYVDHRYDQRCGVEWDCVPVPRVWSGIGDVDGVAYPFVVTQPYVDGASLVHELVRAGGWDAVAKRHRSLPNSTEQVLHRTQDPVRPVDVADESTAAWRLEARERVGEATMYLALWRAARLHDPDPVDPSAIRVTDVPYDRLDYASAPTSGWGGDRLLLYTNGEERGYVWHTVWDTPKDAREFETAYRTLLSAYGAERRGHSTWVVPSERPFADAFHVRTNGTAVRIVNAPTVGSLSALAPVDEGADGLDPATTETDSETSVTSTRTPTMSNPDGVPTTSTTVSVQPSRTSPSEGQGTGFGLVPTLIAVVLAVSIRCIH